MYFFSAKFSQLLILIKAVKIFPEQLDHNQFPHYSYYCLKYITEGYYLKTTSLTIHSEHY